MSNSTQHQDERPAPPQAPPHDPEVFTPPIEVAGPSAHPTGDGEGVDRGMLILDGLRGAAAWAWRFLLVAGALYVLFYIIGKIWVGVLPVILAVLVSTVLWPVVRWLRARRWPSALAAGTVLFVAVATFSGVLAAIAPSVVSQGEVIVGQAGEGVTVLREWVAGPPLNLQGEQITAYLDQATAWVQEQSSRIAESVLTGVTAVGSVLITIVMTLVLSFFILKDGNRFGPWIRRSTGPTAGMHLTEALARVWRTVGGFIKAQAMVSFVDAVLIGLGLLLLGVPMAFVLAIITFFAGFIPIVGAVLAGALAVLVALVSNGFATAVWVLVIVLAVQQVEGNVLSPMLQSRALNLHPALVILVVAAGGTLWGIIGAFLAVPVAAAVVTVIRYLGEHLDLRTGETRAEDIDTLTPEGARAAVLAEGSAPLFRMRARQAFEHAEDERGRAQVAMVGRTSVLAQSLRDRFITPMLRRGDEPEDQAGPPPAGATATRPDPVGTQDPARSPDPDRS
ncbi:AI-2E family transporter [Ornithinimicrobium cerasi]|uniref:Predicted PurR-regulated permease PerM n=1 Tax=Ornithinimicrobium cerasi TaxID=2248773 RepID=A0A285VJY0_9MICO|nr:AI-2E family transporter [Ornithinimicrobium cerasi]SOC54395.1 Predicted PurR-regulated permease PerM [Ornithinimicrobium cerasi]